MNLIYQLLRKMGIKKVRKVKGNTSIAGVICSLIDKMFWGGSLDYMLVYSKIMDLKDLYLFVGGIVYFVEMFKQKRKLAET